MVLGAACPSTRKLCACFMLLLLCSLPRACCGTPAASPTDTRDASESAAGSVEAGLRTAYPRGPYGPALGDVLENQKFTPAYHGGKLYDALDFGPMRASASVTQLVFFVAHVGCMPCKDCLKYIGAGGASGLAFEHEERMLSLSARYPETLFVIVYVPGEFYEREQAGEHIADHEYAEAASTFADFFGFGGPEALNTALVVDRDARFTRHFVEHPKRSPKIMVVDADTMQIKYKMYGCDVLKFESMMHMFRYEMPDLQTSQRMITESARDFLEKERARARAKFGVDVYLPEEIQDAIGDQAEL